MEDSEWKPPLFKVKKWILVVIIFINIFTLFLNAIYITKNLIAREYTFSIVSLGRFLFYLLLLFIFLYGIIKESLCLASSYCTYLLIGIVTIIVEESDNSDEEEGVSTLPTNKPTLWLYLFWTVFTTIVVLLYVIDLMRIQRMCKLKSKTKRTTTSP